MSTPAKLFVKGFKFPIYPTPEQKKLLEQTFGCCRKVYNFALNETKEEYLTHLERKKNNLLSSAPETSGYSLVKRLPRYKANPDLHYLKEVSSVALQQSLLHLGSAYANAFKRGRGLPRFKSKHKGTQSFNLMDTAFRLDENKQLIIAKCDTPIKVVYSQELPSAPTSCTITRVPSGGYYVSFTCRYTPKKTSGQGVVGIDLGLTTLATLSTGEKVGNPRHFKRIQQRLKRNQQSLSRKKKGSANREKAKLQVAKVHARAANARKDHLHKLSTRLVNENQVIGIEDLKVKNMVKNRKLAKHISDASWSSLVNMLLYKCKDSQHTSLVKVDTYYPSSHLCHNTGLKLDRKLQLNERCWECPHCGELHDRDLTAAINIHKEALRILHMYPESDRAGKMLISSIGTPHHTLVT